MTDKDAIAYALAEIIRQRAAAMGRDPLVLACLVLAAVDEAGVKALIRDQ